MNRPPLIWFLALLLLAQACGSEEPVGDRAPGVDKIAFLSCCEPKTALHVMNSDGSNSVPLTEDLSGLPFPLWSPDGSRIAYTRYVVAERLDDVQKDIWVVSIDGSQPVKVSGEGHAGDPTWSVDGRKLAFVRTEIPIAGPVFGEIHTVNADGSDLKRLTELDRDAGKADMLPVWSPDGSKIAHLHAENRQVSLRIMNGNGSDPKDIFTAERINEHLPIIWSPDSTRIAVYVGEQYSNDLVIVNADGSGSTPLTEDGNAAYASWSPDGSRIVYVSTEGLYIADADGQRRVSRVRSEAPDGPSPILPVWSQDGEQIAYVWEMGLDSHGIKIIEADGSREVDVATQATVTPTISWSPDGKRLAFDNEVNGEGEIFVVNADGTGLTNLTNSPSSEHEPIWSP